MKYFVLLATVLLIFVINEANAIPPLDPKHIYEASDIIVVGKIIFVNSTFSPELNLYHIQTDKFLKNPQKNNIIFAAGQNAENIRVGNQVFENGDSGLFLLRNNTSVYGEQSEIFQLHYASQRITPEWDACDIFSNDFPKEHWVFGGKPRLEVEQENRTEYFVTGKTILITYDIFNHVPTEKKIDFSMTIRNIDKPDSLYLFHENAYNILEPCTPYRTITWTFTLSEQGRYSFELDNLMGSKQSTAIQVRDPTKSNFNEILSPLKQFESGIPIGEIQCGEGLVLISKSSDGSPACVKPATKQKLVEIGWANDEPVTTYDKKSNLSESEIEYFPINDPCDFTCKERLESENYTCTKLEANSYGCREEIRLVHELIYTYVIPPELGEYYLIPPNSEQKLGSIRGVSIHDDDSIQVTFDEKFNKDSIVIEKNQPFSGFCFESKNLHVWTFTGVIEISGKQYIEMHKRLAKIPDGFDCNNLIHILDKS